MNTRLIGRWGEAKAGEFLRSKGYDIIGMNFTTRFGEIDLIAKNRQYVVFVEVKLRKSASFAEAREFVDHHKIHRIKTTAAIWLSRNETDKRTRFDVIEIYFSGSEAQEIKKIIHLEDAFR